MAKSFEVPTLRKFLSGASLVALLFFAVSASVHHVSAAWRAGQQSTAQPQPVAVSGKVTAIASDKKSISLEVTDNGSKNTMQFVLDDNTRVTGRVSVGTVATVQYQSAEGGKLLALNISPNTQ